MALDVHPDFTKFVALAPDLDTLEGLSTALYDRWNNGSQHDARDYSALSGLIVALHQHVEGMMMKVHGDGEAAHAPQPQPQQRNEPDATEQAVKNESARPAEEEDDEEPAGRTIEARASDLHASCWNLCLLIDAATRTLDTVEYTTPIPAGHKVWGSIYELRAFIRTFRDCGGALCERILDIENKAYALKV
jgi:hypothetical protein